MEKGKKNGVFRPINRSVLTGKGKGKGKGKGLQVK